MEIPWTISSYTIRTLFTGSKCDQSDFELSLDLGISACVVRNSENGIILPDGTILSWSNLERVLEDTHSCFAVVQGELKKIEAYSEFTERYYSLYPTPRAPTMLVSGIPMHRIKDTDPYADTLAKLRAARPVGRVLDTTTGLGYTAIESSKTAEHVMTIELDPAVLEICRCNPWSQPLFENPNITQRIGDSFELIHEFSESSFSCVIHDPPTFSLAGELYSGEFYSQVYRVLRSNGRLFHYIGDLNSPSGRRVARGAAQRMQQVGFIRVVPHPEAFALMAYKR
jgi:predicted methyltransferase